MVIKRIRKIVRRRTEEELKSLEEVSKSLEKKRGIVSKFKRKLFSKEGKEAKKTVRRRAVGTKKLLTAMAVIQPKRKGAGRPFKSYKYGMPIHQYKKKQSQQRALYAQYQAEQRMKLRGRGLTPEQITQLQQIRTMQEMQEGRVPIQIVRKQSQRPQIERQVKLSKGRGYPQPPPNVADDELRFRKWMADKTVSPNTQKLLTQIRRIQNKGKVDNIEQQRRHWERRLVGASTNLMKAHENMNPIRLDFTGVNDEENILMAENVFKENSENNILRKRSGSRTILDTGEFTLKF